jgi:formamidopyrimidine-DNA glycosylase
MPELGEVEGFRRLLSDFGGAVIVQVHVIDASVLRNSDPSRFIASVEDRRIGVARRTGKWLSLEIDEAVVVFHFGMTGSLEHRSGGHRRDDRVVFVTDRGELRYRDLRKLRGVFLAADADEEHRIIGDVGVDALAVSAPVLRARLESHRGSIKAALVDQRRVAGIGNFGSDEILWRARIHPNTSVTTLDDDQWSQLHRALSTVLRTTAAVGHTPRGPHWLTGARFTTPAQCPRCSNTLDRGVISGRTAVWCPACQPAD